MQISFDDFVGSVQDINNTIINRKTTLFTLFCAILFILGITFFVFGIFAFVISYLMFLVSLPIIILLLFLLFHTFLLWQAEEGTATVLIAFLIALLIDFIMLNFLHNKFKVCLFFFFSFSSFLLFSFFLLPSLPFHSLIWRYRVLTMKEDLKV